MIFLLLRLPCIACFALHLGRLGQCKQANTAFTAHTCTHTFLDLFAAPLFDLHMTFCVCSGFCHLYTHLFLYTTCCTPTTCTHTLPLHCILCCVLPFYLYLPVCLPPFAHRWENTQSGIVPDRATAGFVTCLSYALCLYSLPSPPLPYAFSFSPSMQHHVLNNQQTCNFSVDSNICLLRHMPCM